VTSVAGLLLDRGSLSRAAFVSHAVSACGTRGAIAAPMPQYSPFHTKVINVGVRDDLRIEEHVLRDECNVQRSISKRIARIAA
jgi:hypothetical protein